MIKEVKSIEDANRCDELLTKLIQDERKYNDSIDENFIVKDHFNQMLESKDIKILAYYVENLIVGYILIRKISDVNCLLDGLFVLEEYRNQGIGQKLLDVAIEKCKEYDIKYIDIKVMEENKIAKDIYKKYGFNEFEVTLRKTIK